MLTQEYKNEREKNKREKASMKLAKALNREAKKNIAHDVKPKTEKEKKPHKKEKEDYRITYCKFVKIDDPNDLVSAIS